MTFRYQGYPVRGIDGTMTQVYRPTIPLRVIGPTGGSMVFGLLDTGADDTLLPDRLLGLLGVGIGPDARIPVWGIGGGTVAADFGAIGLQLRGHRWSATAGFYSGNRVLLGHSGFLEHFGASFNGVARTVRLRIVGHLPVPINPTD